MHYGKVETSKIMQKLLAVLTDGNWHTTLELQQATNCVCVGTNISSLRQNGFVIECKYQGKGGLGSRVFAYRLANGPVVMPKRKPCPTKDALVKAAQPSVHATTEANLCKLKSCRKFYLPKRKSQTFCKPTCRETFYATAREIGVKEMGR